jgi:hypothetical protein
MKLMMMMVLNHLTSRTATVDVHYTYNPKFGDYRNVNVVMIIIVILMGMIIMKLWVVSIVVAMILM